MYQAADSRLLGCMALIADRPICDRTTRRPDVDWRPHLAPVSRGGAVTKATSGESADAVRCDDGNAGFDDDPRYDDPRHDDPRYDDPRHDDGAARFVDEASVVSDTPPWTLAARDFAA